MARFVIWVGAAAFAAFCLFETPGKPQAASESAVYVDIRASETPDAKVVDRLKLYGSSHALIIGINNYVGGWPRLSNAVKDAELVANALQDRGFEVNLLRNPKAAALESSLKEFFIVKGENPEARLFVWFAGHGHTEYGEGFLIPSDAPLPRTGAGFRLKALSLRRFGEYVRLAQSKHAYAVFDACFAGTVFGSQRALPPTAITRATARPVRQFLSSGDADQQVSDDGTFRQLFLRALTGEGRADANGDGYLTASELGLHLTDRVTNLTRARQTPRYGKLLDPRFDRGDFIFLLPREKATTETASQPEGPGSRPSEAVDLAFWTAIKESGDPGQFQAYLRAFPDGRFAHLAKVLAGQEEKPPSRKQSEPKPSEKPDELVPAAPVVQIEEPVALSKVEPSTQEAVLPPADNTENEMGIDEFKKYISSNKRQFKKAFNEFLRRTKLTGPDDRLTRIISHDVVTKYDSNFVLSMFYEFSSRGAGGTLSPTTASEDFLVVFENGKPSFLGVACGKARRPLGCLSVFGTARYP